MFVTLGPSRPWSKWGLEALKLCIALSIALSLLDGVVASADSAALSITTHAMLQVWISDFRYLAEHGVYASTLFFVGARFFETRTILTIGFDKADAARLSVKGPDESNIVWIGRRYQTVHEARAVATAMEGRLRDS